LYQQVAQTASKILKEQMEQTRVLLEENRAHLDAVAKALQERNRLYRKDLEEILPALPARQAAEAGVEEQASPKKTSGAVSAKCSPR
jgi:hypothetical protein